MMGAGPLLTLTPDARSELDRYLRRVKAALRAHPSVDVDEIERDIRGHIEAELTESPTPITEARLHAVLDRLGTPSQWVPADELSAWRKLLVRLRSGPEDWRLAYLTFALFISSPLTFALFITSTIVVPIAGLLFFASILVARATLALLAEEDEAIGARRWLVYPSLFVTYLVVVFSIFVAVPAVVASAGDPSIRTEMQPWFPEPLWASLPFAVALAAGLWWTLLGLVCARFTGAVQFLFWPFANWFERRHGTRIAVIGLSVSTVAGAALAALVWSR
jgi:hypothetical protein